jgi:hypothetical protein
MPEFVRAYSGDDTNTLVTVSAAFAENAGLRTVKDDATDKRGRPLPPSKGYRTSARSTAAKNTSGGEAASTAEEATE